MTRIRTVPAVYLRNRKKDGQVACRLLCGKSRVSPIKEISLPRLELCAALLAAQLMETITRAIRICINKRYYFTDFVLKLHDINSNANLWQVFVANRVSQIQHLSKASEWHHVDTKDNPANLISHGVYANRI